MRHRRIRPPQPSQPPRENAVAIAIADARDVAHSLVATLLFYGLPATIVAALYWIARL